MTTCGGWVALIVPISGIVTCQSEKISSMNASNSSSQLWVMTWLATKYGCPSSTKSKTVWVPAIVSIDVTSRRTSSLYSSSLNSGEADAASTLRTADTLG